MRTVRCDLLPEDCVADHLCPVLDARPRAGGWRARCPAHDDQHASLTVAVGNRGARIVWKCHAGCTEAAVHEAMVRRGIRPGCIPITATRPTTRPTGEEAKLDKIEKLLTDPPAGVKLMQIELAMILWECDRHTAAQKLGIGWRTAYRARDSR